MRLKAIIAFSVLGLFLSQALVFGFIFGTKTKRTTIDRDLYAKELQKQQDIALQTLFLQEQRLNRVAFPLLMVASDLNTKNVRPYLGFQYRNMPAMPKDYRQAGARLYGMDNTLQIIEVVPESPADLAGLQPGDKLVSLDGHPFPKGRRANLKMLRFLKKHLAAGQPSVISVLRDGEEMNLMVTPVNVSDFYLFFLYQDAGFNAYADGKSMYFTSGILSFAQSDDALALIIGHELAHNVMTHMRAKKANYLLGSILDLAAAAGGVDTQNAFGKIAFQAHSKKFEQEADYVGLYIMARAGIEIQESANFWRRFAAEIPKGVRRSFLSSHPTSPERFLAMEQTIEEIQLKRQAGLPIVPDMK